MIFRNKKGVTEVAELAIIMFMILPILFFLNLYANSFIINDVDTSLVEDEIILERFLYSPDGFIYYDSSINRYYPGVVDLSKFNETYMENTVVFNNKFMSVKFSLLYENGKSNVTYFDKRHYELYSDLAGVGSRVRKYNKNYFVRVIDGTTTKNAVLTMDAVVFNDA